MAAEKETASSSDGNGEGLKSNNVAETHVFLNVYDLTPANDYMYWFGFGIFHSGIQVHGMEYGFGAHDFPASGVFEVEPKTCPGFIFRCSIPLGRIKMPPAEFRAFIENMASEYHGDTYHLISKNCNHFSDDLCWRLMGRHIPNWVNRLARHGALCSCLLPESLQLTAVKQPLDYQGAASEEENESFYTITPREPIESDDPDQEKHLLSLTVGNTKPYGMRMNKGKQRSNLVKGVCLRRGCLCCVEGVSVASRVRLFVLRVSVCCNLH